MCAWHAFNRVAGFELSRAGISPNSWLMLPVLPAPCYHYLEYQDTAKSPKGKAEVPFARNRSRMWDDQESFLGLAVVRRVIVMFPCRVLSA